MMDKAGIWNIKGTFLAFYKRGIMLTIAISFTAWVACPPAMSEEQPFPHLPQQSANVTSLHYEANPPDESYTMAWKLMEDIFAHTTHDRSLPYEDKPYLMVAKTDLNNDNEPDYIAYPVEFDEIDDGAFCSAGNFCPHYVYTGSLEEPVLLGKIFAHSIDTGDDVMNGYKTLKVFTREQEGKIFPERFGFYDTYKYDPETKQYKDALIMPNRAKKSKEPEKKP